MSSIVVGVVVRDSGHIIESNFVSETTTYSLWRYRGVIFGWGQMIRSEQHGSATAVLCDHCPRSVSLQHVSVRAGATVLVYIFLHKIV